MAVGRLTFHQSGRPGSIPDLSRFSVISWDVDGTLYSLPAMSSVVGRLAIQRILNNETRRTISELAVLRRFRHRMANIRADGGSLPSKVDRKSLFDRLSIEQRWYGEAIRRVGLRAGLREVFDQFRKAGFVQIVVSDYDCTYKLNCLEIEDIFEHVYAGEQLGHIKPSPQLFSFVVNQLCINPDHLLHIGDRRDRDGAAATAAGCEALILGEDFRSFPQFSAHIARRT